MYKQEYGLAGMDIQGRVINNYLVIRKDSEYASTCKRWIIMCLDCGKTVSRTIYAIMSSGYKCSCSEVPIGEKFGRLTVIV